MYTVCLFSVYCGNGHVMAQTLQYIHIHRAMQELLVHFQPEPSVPPPTPSTLSSLTTVAGQSGK